jgi:membrane protein YqaA with SNARE-associated domain
MDTSIHAVKFPILVTDFWTWAAIVGLSATPNLVLGPSTAVAMGIAAHYSPLILVPVIAVASYLEGLVVAWLGGESTRIGFVSRWVARMRTPRSMAIANKWGVWGGLSLGCALVGQEPILVALRWLGVDMRRIWLPLAVSNAVFAVVYYAIVWVGLDQVANH